MSDITEQGQVFGPFCCHLSVKSEQSAMQGSHVIVVFSPINLHLPVSEICKPRISHSGPNVIFSICYSGRVEIVFLLLPCVLSQSHDLGLANREVQSAGAGR